MTTTNKVECCTFDDLLKGEIDAESKQAINDYLHIFARPEDEGKCLKCGTVQGGLMATILGGFTYDLVHGEGHCTKCHWPARADHYIKDKDGKELGRLRIILQYHPDGVVEKEGSHDPRSASALKRTGRRR